jgi:CYTH domain-containing protein
VISRAPGLGRYARPEREQRWLLSRLPDGVHRPVPIVDRYIRGTRLRLRRMEGEDELIYKLAQKVRPDTARPELVQLTNIYLSEVEYTTLLSLGADEVRKTRWHWTSAERTLAVDEFGGRLAGLILAEMELHPGEPRRERPPGAVADVTDDDRFSGGRLARMTPLDLRAALSDVGGTTSSPPLA